MTKNRFKLITARLSFAVSAVCMAVPGVVAAVDPSISGYVRTSGGSGMDGVFVSADNGGGSNTTDSSGFYELAVSNDWSGMVTPVKSGYGFTPESQVYSNVTADLSNQDYTGADVPPANVSSFLAVPSNTTVQLTWENPGDADFTGVRVLRKTSGYSTNENDGTVVYDGNGTEHADAGLTNRTRYYYSAFAYDTGGNFAAGSPYRATPYMVEPIYPALAVTRLNNLQPLIDQSSFTALGIADDGHNINGPCCVRVPDWVAPEDRADPTAVYYLYFANHGGDYIRMAWAVELEGPWTLFNCGTNDDPGYPGRGVLDLGLSDEIRYTTSDGLRVKGHIASPDVIIDHTNQQFILYFHGPTYKPDTDSTVFATGEQKTVVATSASGLNFNLPDGMSDVTGGVGGGEAGHGLKNATLGNAYFRTFEYNGSLYAFSNYGPIWKALNPAVPWETTSPRSDAWTQQSKEENPVWIDLRAKYITVNDMSDPKHNPAPPRYNAGKVKLSEGAFKDKPRNGGPRHFATMMQDDGHTLEVWYSSRGDAPERIFRTTMDLSQGTWQTWDTIVCDSNTVHQEMLRPELDWEGADLPVKGSQNGSEVDVHQLRDPYLFRDSDGKIYLFYTGEGEEAIGLAQVHAPDAFIDTDKDGMSNNDEAVAGTNPYDPDSYFQISDTVISNGMVSIEWASVSNRNYQVYISSNLVHWSVYTNNIVADPPINWFQLPASWSNAFFRLQVSQ